MTSSFQVEASTEEPQEISGPGIRLDFTVWKTSEETLRLSTRVYTFLPSEVRTSRNLQLSHYGAGSKFVGVFPVAIFWVSGEEGLRETLLSRRAGKVLIGIRYTF